MCCSKRRQQGLAYNQPSCYSCGHSTNNNAAPFKQRGCGSRNYCGGCGDRYNNCGSCGYTYDGRRGCGARKWCGGCGERYNRCGSCTTGSNQMASQNVCALCGHAGNTTSQTQLDSAIQTVRAAMDNPIMAQMLQDEPPTYAAINGACETSDVGFQRRGFWATVFARNQRNSVNTMPLNLAHEARRTDAKSFGTDTKESMGDDAASIKYSEKY